VRLFDAFLDDAAVFPPGSLPLGQAVPAHLAHRESAQAPLVGPFVVAASSLPSLGELVRHLPPRSFPLSVTVPGPGSVRTSLEAAYRIPAVDVRAVEVSVPSGVVDVGDVVAALDLALRGEVGRTSDGRRVTVFVEVPRDERRGALIHQLAGTAYLAKLRTGGVRSDLYPDAFELGSAIVALVRAGVPFKATAGLHHAVCNTDAATGFEQHGFLNALVAVAAVLDGADAIEAAVLLADRDGVGLAASLDAWPTGQAEQVRRVFRSIGTCSIDEPVSDLIDLGLLEAAEGVPA
jgi:hypothetical protein